MIYIEGECVVRKELSHNALIYKSIIDSFLNNNINLTQKIIQQNLKFLTFPNISKKEIAKFHINGNYFPFNEFLEELEENPVFQDKMNILKPVFQKYRDEFYKHLLLAISQIN